MWHKISGVVTPGYQIASGLNESSPYPLGSIEMQVPYFKERGLDLTGFYFATINVDISPFTFSLNAPKFTFEHVAWCSQIPPETFSFSSCKFISLEA